MVTPVVERVAKQMRAAQVLKVSRAAARNAAEEMEQADREQVRLREYLALLGDDIAQHMIAEMDEDLHAVRAASPKAKYVTAAAFQAQRFMRDLDKK